MERVDTAGAPLAGGILRAAPTRTLLGGRLGVTRWRLAVDDAGFTEAMSTLIASSYLTRQMPWGYPDPTLVDRLPAQGSAARKGDFGEIVAGVLYANRLGWYVPFQRLEAKPISGATLQGTDLLALTLDHGENPKPTIVEVKYRAAISPANDLKALAMSLAGIDEDYLVAAWAAGVSLMENHAEVDKSFALSAAQHLARLIHPDEPVPPHECQAVIVTGGDTLTDAKITEHWGAAPPVSELHIITVPDLEAVMDSLYEMAGRLQYADAASGVPALLGARRHLPGLASPVSSTEAKRAVAAGRADGTLAVVEASLWLLADWDGMGVARARQLVDGAGNAAVRGLAQILTGGIGAAGKTLADHETLADFARDVHDALYLAIGTSDLRAGTSDSAAKIPEEGLAEAVRYVGAAIAHRLPRHPKVLTAGAGATGSNVEHVVATMQRYGRHALWPSQAAAISGGLLDRGHPALAIKMPTSAGKTALIELLIADTLDSSPDVVTAVLAPTRALVSQLSSDLRKALPPSADVRSSHGGLDFDTEEPSATGILAKPGVAVMTPERFDLEWRRANTGDEHAQVDHLALLVVDEAHLIAAERRGARLELVIARALRRGIRVVVLSAQFPDLEKIAQWVDGRPIESDWTPTWLERFVYFPDPERATGLLQGEIGDPTPCLTLSKSANAEPGTTAPGRTGEAAALAELQGGDGLIVLYSNQRRYMPNLQAAVGTRVGTDAEPDPDLETLARSLDATQPRYAALLRAGIGVHHAGVPQAVRHAVEHGARRDLLRYVICTSALLEGVDFPTRTVIAVYPTQDRGQPEVARLRNLAGRAGRAGRFTRGTLIVMVAGPDKAPRWLRAFRAALPLTPSALERALRRVRAFANQIDVLEPANDTDGAVADLDALILAAVIEGAVIDGDLRTSLEAHLGRTLWWTGTSANAREAILDQAVQRAERIAGMVGGSPWQTAFYRTGLPLASSIKLRNALGPHIEGLAQALTDPDQNPDDTLLWMAASVATAAPELDPWRQLATADLQDTLTRWLHGEPTDTIEGDHPEVWSVIDNDLDTLLPWVLTAVIEYTTTARQQPDLRDLAHQRLALARLRYGVPDKDLCDYVRRGADRVVVTQLAAEYAALPPLEQFFQHRDDYITARLNPSNPTPVEGPAA